MGKRNKEESKLQRACVRWFKLQYPKLALALFAVPNGGSRNKIEAYNLKLEGVTAGVSDLVLALPGGGYHGMFIEMKTTKGIVRKSQKEFLALMGSLGYRTEVVRDFDRFVEVVEDQMEKYKSLTNNK